MNVIPFVHEGLGNSSYLVQVRPDEAVVIDPSRGVDKYLDSAEERGWKITNVLETHVHADFVSGARDIANETGAEIDSPEAGGYEFPHRPVKPDERFGIGTFEVDAIGSPGHTPEHLSYVLRGDGEPPALFSGGSLLVGGAARTDLISPDLTEKQTHWLFNTLQTAYAALPDETLLLPTHGSGSFCSAVPGTSRTSTLGEERQHNAALAITDEDEFVEWFPTTFPAIPAYYARMRPINQRGPTLRGDIVPPPALEPVAFDYARQAGLVIDVRPTEEYAAGHIPGALSIEFRDAYAVWLGWLAPPDTPLLFVTGEEPLQSLIDESTMVGYEEFAGRLEGGMAAWQRAELPVFSVPRVDALEAKKALVDGAAAIDVREPDEFEAGHVADAVNIPLGQLEARVAEVPKDRPVVAYCGVGERSASGVSILERAGYDNLMNLEGGYGAWRKAGLPKEA